MKTIKDVKEGLEKDFADRQPTQASTSKYIQTNITSAEGYLNKVVEGTPDDKIIKPNLKVFNCETISFKLPFGLGLLPIPIPFIGTKNKKEIKEVAPTKEKSQYGKIQVSETKGGFVEIKDETPDNKRWVQLHPAGTYKNIVNDGSEYHKVAADSYVIIDKNWNIAIGEDCVEIITGNNKIQIKKNIDVNINGNESVNIDGNSNTNINSNKGLQVKGNNCETIEGDSTHKIHGKLTETIVKDHKKQIDGSNSINITNNKTEIVGKNINTMSGGTITISASGNINVVASGVCNIKGARVNIN